MTPSPKLPIPNGAIARLHAVYQECSGLRLGISMLWIDEYVWGEWMRYGWTEGDLRLVCAHLKHQYPKYAVKMMRFSTLIGDPSVFRERLAEAKAMQRNTRPIPDARALALKAVGRSEDHQKMQEAKRVDAVATEILQKGWEKLKQETGL